MKTNNRHYEFCSQTEVIHPLWIATAIGLAMTSAATLGLLLSPPMAFASSTITAIPPRLQLEAKPGETLRATIKVRNDSEISQSYTVYVNDFIVNDESGTPIPISENITGKWSLRKWIVAPNYLPVDSKTTQNVELVIRIPSSAAPGGHYAMITYMPNADLNPSELKKTASVIGQRVGTLIYVTVKGKINEKANITTFTSAKFNEKGPVSFSGTLENLSDVHIQPAGFIAISDIFNNEVAKLPLELGNVFPDNIKKFSSTWNQKWGYGRYKADLNLVYGSASTVLVASIFFWLFPIRLVIYTLIVLISFLAIAVLLSKRSKRHQEELEAEVKALQKEIDNLERK